MKGKRKRPHPIGCRHCAFVEDYRAERQRQIAEWENGGWRDENAPRCFLTFKQALINLGIENRAIREAAAA